MPSGASRPRAEPDGAAPRAARVPDDGVEAPADRIVSVAILVVVALVVLQTVGYLVGALALDGSVAVLDADTDTSIWSWLSVGLSFVCAFLLLAFAVVGSQRGLALVVAVPVAFLSADDLLRWHERVSAAADPYLPLSRGWPIVYLPLLVALFLGLWRLADGLPRPARSLVQRGLPVLGGAVALELLAAVLLEVVDDKSFWYTLQVAVEEAAELAGWALVASGLLAGLVATTREVAPA